MAIRYWRWRPCTTRHFLPVVRRKVAMTTLLAIDASTTTVGWAVFVDGEYRESGVYMPISLDAWQRIMEYGKWLRKWWNYRFHGPPIPRIVAYELATGNRGNMRTNRLLGAVEYATRINIMDAQLITVTASQVIATGCHKIKGLVGAAVASDIAGKEITKADEIDAIGVALAALAKMGAAYGIKTKGDDQ